MKLIWDYNSWIKFKNSKWNDSASDGNVFKNRIEVSNNNGQSVTGMFRIFMAPTTDERGQPLAFEEQRRLMIELDKFQQGCEYNQST